MGCDYFSEDSEEMEIKITDWETGEILHKKTIDVKKVDKIQVDIGGVRKR